MEGIDQTRTDQSADLRSLNVFEIILNLSSFSAFDIFEFFSFHLSEDLKSADCLV